MPATYDADTAAPWTVTVGICTFETSKTFLTHDEINLHIPACATYYYPKVMRTHKNHLISSLQAQYVMSKPSSYSMGKE